MAGAGGAAHAVVFACLAAGARRGDGRQPDRGVGGRAGQALRAASAIGVARSAVALDDPAFARRARRRPTWPSTRRPSGWSIRGSTIAVDRLPADATVFDLVYVPAETPLLAAARARGLRAANGSEMLIAQAAIAFERWTGVGGMADVMRAAVAPLLADAAARA